MIKNNNQINIPDHKICGVCKIDKPKNEFGPCKQRKDGLRFECFECRKRNYYVNHEKMLEQKKQDHLKHKQERNKKTRIFYYQNKNKILKQSKEYSIKNKDKIKKYHDFYRQKNYDIIQTKKKIYRDQKRRELWEAVNKSFKDHFDGWMVIFNDLMKYEEHKKVRCRLAQQMAIRIINAVRRRKLQKSGHSSELLGCKTRTLLDHLESQFHNGMTWENWGNKPGTWQVDHIIPCCSFDLSKKEEQLKAFNYKNLQPLWHDEHITKTTKDRKISPQKISKLPNF